MYKFCKLLIALLLTVLINSFHAQSAVNENNPKPVKIAGSHWLHLTSEIVNQEYDIYVYLPRNYNDPNRNFPVLYLLDAQWDFPLVLSLFGEQYYDGFVPDVIVVGITWGGKNPNYDLLRARDFTPTQQNGNQYSGGAKLFLNFIKAELIPFMESNYRVNDDRALMGSSLGGLFTLYTLFTEPDIFDKYVLTSPALLWSNGVLFNYEREFSSQKIPLSKKVYSAIGSYEDVVTYQKFIDQLKNRNYEGLRLESRVLDGIGHSGSKAEGYTRGIQFVYERPSIILENSVLSKYVGLYEAISGTKFQIVTENNQLAVIANMSTKIPLTAENEYSFYSKGEYLFVRFTIDNNGKVTGSSIETYGGTKTAKKVE